MANVKFQYRSKKDNAQIEIRFTLKDENGKFKSYYTRTQLEVSKEFFNDYQKKKDFRDTDKRNLKIEIDNLYNELNTIILNAYNNADEEITGDWLKNVVDEYYNPPKKENENNIPDDLIAFYDYYIQIGKSEGQAKRTITGKFTKRNNLEKFTKYKKKKFKVKDVNQRFIDDWKKWSLDIQKYKESAIEREFSQLMTVCREARLREIEVSPKLDLLKCKINTDDDTDIVYLTFEELDRIKSMPGLNERLDNVRDWLLISCYTAQRISDFKRFNKNMIRTDETGSYLDIKQQKTKKEVSIPLMPIVLEILDKRNGDFPPMISEQKYNLYAKELCKTAEINDIVYSAIRQKTDVGSRSVISEYEKWEKVSSHIGRRSFASNYYGIVPTAYLTNITGHKTEAMLLKYIGKTAEDTAEQSYQLMRNHYNNLNSK
jgi:hypothetical protein